jgi:hypothetical protein
METASVVQRDTLNDGTVRLFSSKSKCTFYFLRPRPGVVVIRISGDDRGEFGTAPMDELREDLSRFAPVELFIETDKSAGAALPVQTAWTEWFAENRSALKSVSMLVHSKYMHFTAEVAKLFSRTGEMIRVYLDPAPYDEALGRAVPGYKVPRRE